jgi:nitrite reductase/ring-hydroxylating ferredoxin subunit/uncharacterized membrane protein
MAEEVAKNQIHAPAHSFLEGWACAVPGLALTARPGPILSLHGPAQDAQNGDGDGMTHPASIFPAADIQPIMSAVLNAPVLAGQLQQARRMSFMLDLLSFFLGQPALFQASYWSMALGVGTGLLAAVPGVVDYTEIRHRHPAGQTATWHMLLNVAAIVLYGFSLGIRYPVYGEAASPDWLQFLLALGALGVLMFSGYLGGTLVYDDGIGVGRHRHKGRLPQETIRVTPEEGSGFATVGKEENLGEGESWRVDLEGTIVTVARMPEGFVAFQEFCTHRYGPLSEGCLREGQVECPWHRSRFDVRTGEVTEGPAKLGLKVFEVEVREGKVRLRQAREGRAGA